MDIVIIIDTALLALTLAAYYFGLKTGARYDAIVKSRFGWTVAALLVGTALVWTAAAQASHPVAAFYLPALISVAAHYTIGVFSARYAKTLNRNRHWGWWIWVPFGFIGMLFTGPRKEPSPA
ncbi:hypothetical protein LCL97_11610 [Seohaeicola saemankumensis]|nr:hypothetical protein [Seohaeicola saemankumensis]MCA0871476.1 hypothetical protein [Seohaeicola saemankumensis]